VQTCTLKGGWVCLTGLDLTRLPTGYGEAWSDTRLYRTYDYFQTRASYNPVLQTGFSYFLKPMRGLSCENYQNRTIKVLVKSYWMSRMMSRFLRQCLPFRKGLVDYLRCLVSGNPCLSEYGGISLHSTRDFTIGQDNFPRVERKDGMSTI
jgi:hypothetical protein